MVYRNLVYVVRFYICNLTKTLDHKDCILVIDKIVEAVRKFGDKEAVT